MIQFSLQEKLPMKLVFQTKGLYHVYAISREEGFYDQKLVDEFQYGGSPMMESPTSKMIEIFDLLCCFKDGFCVRSSSSNL
mgnify:CR=1 FL=1